MLAPWSISLLDLLAQADPPTDLLSPRVLGVLAPFFGLLVFMLWRSERKRDEAEELIRTMYRAQLEVYQPTVQRFLDYIESEERMERTRRRRST